MLGCMYASYMVRDFPAEFQESRFIDIAILSMAQIYFVAVPSIVAVYSQVTGRFVVEFCIIFVTYLAVTLSMFVPKFFFVYAPTWWDPNGHSSGSAVGDSLRVAPAGTSAKTDFGSDATSPRIASSRGLSPAHLNF